MKAVTQALLVASYLVTAAAVGLLLWLVGVPAATAQVIGVLVFVGAWQGQISFFGGVRDDPDAIDMHRVEEIEKLALQLRDDVEDLQANMEEQSEKGDQKDKKLVSELKSLQELLLVMMQKETRGKAKPKKVAPPAPKPEPAAEPEAEDQMTAEDIEELGLAPEEAALVVIDDGTLEDAAPDAAAQVTPPESEPADDRIALEDIEQVPPVKDQGPVETAKAPAKKSTKPAAKAAPTKAPAAEAPAAKPKAIAQQPRPVKPRAPIRLIKREDQLLSVIKNSLSENRVDLYLQPIVSLPSRKTSHFECFSRVRDEEGRVVLPRQYMKVAETRGLVGTIDNLLLFRLIQLVRRLGKRRPDIRFFCNMSRYSISDDEFFPQFVDFMASNREFADRLVFEISQEDYLTFEEDVLERLETLGRRGFAYSMDMVSDFEQDFSDLEDLNFRFLKADLADIMDANPEPGDVEAQKDYLRRRGIQLIASKIETEDMVIEALDNQIELAQGYLFGEPLSAADIDHDL